MPLRFLVSLLICILLNSPSFAETITLNGEDDWAPYSSATADYKDVQGLAPDIIRAAFKTQSVTVRIRPVPFARCMLEVDKGTALGCFDTIINQDTKDRYIFHKTPLFQAEMVVYGPISSQKTSITVKDLEGKVVGWTTGYTYPPSFRDNKKIIPDVVPTERAQLEKLAAGRIEYAVMWGLTGEHILQKHPHLSKKVKALGSISRDSLYINFSKSHPDGAKYAGVFEKGLQAIMVNGTYKKLEDDFRKKHLRFKSWAAKAQESKKQKSKEL
ncbi:MAG: transporter substrate-binding domain-containing protein [Bdellovibrio sp.]|nr:transporter substrate-binding domain-containing protein [Bdellovibrio sp.]